jgi:hypothetical protein
MMRGNTRYPLASESIPDNLGGVILARQRREFLDRAARIEWGWHATDDIADPALLAFLSLGMTDAEREGVVAPSAGVRKGLVFQAEAWRQFQRTAASDCVFDNLFIEQRRDVASELGGPLSTSRLRIVLDGLGYCDLRNGWIELRGGAFHHEDIVIVLVVVVAVLAEQQPTLAIRRADTDQHAASACQGGQHGAIGLNIWQRALLRALVSGLIKDTADDRLASNVRFVSWISQAVALLTILRRMGDRLRKAAA